jgi:hypothetical protein
MVPRCRRFVTSAHLDTEVTEIAAIRCHLLIYDLRHLDCFLGDLVSDPGLARRLYVRETKHPLLMTFQRPEAGT